MSDADCLSTFASALGDRSRAAICLALFHDRPWTAGELARHVGIAPSTASQHITTLVDVGLLVEQRRGRRRHVRLASAEVAQIIEDLAEAAGATPKPARSLSAQRASRRLAEARTCYDHLAGRLGVRVYDSLVCSGLVSERDGLVLTPEGASWVAGFAGDQALTRAGRRPLLRSCIDWTERRPHLAGSVGAALCDQFLRRGWVVRVRESRAVILTEAGAAAIASPWPAPG